MSDAVAVRPSRSLPLEAVLILIPVLLALAGIAIRYAGYAATVPDASLANFAEGMCRWDCDWYVTLANQGYDGFPTPKLINAGNWAFFPLYPLLVSILKSITGLETIVAGTALSIVTCIASARVAWPLLGRDLKAYTLFSAFLVAGPFSIWFTTFYTEVLFLFLTVCVFAALERRRFVLAGVFAALLSATRIVGCFIVFAIVIELWRAHREAGGTWRDAIPGVLKRPDWLLAIFLAPLGLFAYMLFLHLHIGDAIAFSHVQRAWARPTGLPPMFLYDALFDPAPGAAMPTFSQQLAIATLVGYALAITLIVRRQFAMGVYSLLCLTAPLFAGMASMLRFTAGLAPLSILLSRLLASRTWLFAIALLVFLVGGYFTTIGWLTEYLTLV